MTVGVNRPSSGARWPGSQLPPRLGQRALRGLSGVLAGGLVMLAVLVGLAQWLVSEVNRPGPGTAAVLGYAVAALIAVAAQVVADRCPGPRGSLAAGAILVLVAVVLWYGWYS